MIKSFARSVFVDQSVEILNRGVHIYTTGEVCCTRRPEVSVPVQSATLARSVA